MALAPNANQITVRQVLGRLEGDFAAMAAAVENGEFALWVGSGTSRRAPSLGDLIDRAIEALRQGAVDAATAGAFVPALRSAITLAGQDPVALEPRFVEPFVDWPEYETIRSALWDNYSRVLDIRIAGRDADYVLWDAINIRDAFSNPPPPAAEHLCIAILVMEGVVSTIASGNWDGFIEDAIRRLSSGANGTLQIVVDPNHMRGGPGRAQLLKFHGCIVYATGEPLVFRQYLTGSRTQIMSWPEEQRFAAMCNVVVNVAASRKALVLGLSIQDNNLQSVFARAKQLNAWPWPCAPASPAHVFCEDIIKQGQEDVLRIVYGDAYNDHVDDILAGSHLRSWAEQVLIALVLKVLTDKLSGFMAREFEAAGKAAIAPLLAEHLVALRNDVADRAIRTPDPLDASGGSRTDAALKGIGLWSRILSLFRSGRLPTSTEAYEALSASPPALLAADPNANVMAFGRLAAGLALLQQGRSIGNWTLGEPATDDLTAGAMTAQSTRPGALSRPVFLVKSATDAIALQEAGAFANDNAVVVHADDTWHRMVASGGSARRVSSAPGRTGAVNTLHVSLGDMISSSVDGAALQDEFAARLIL